MKSYIWMKNPHGVNMEVDSERKDKLLKEGFKEIPLNEVKIPKLLPLLNVAIPGQSQYPYGGYGRVVELLEQCFRFNPESKNKIYIGYPRPIEKQIGDRLILITAFEADKLPKDWSSQCSLFDLIIVPSQWVREIFGNCGITQPVEVMIQGTDNFSVVPELHTTPFRFLHYNAFSDFKRKGWDLVVKAFIELFGIDNKVELILKGRKHDNEKDITEVPKRANIRIVIQNMKRYEIEKLQEEANCFVFPSRGEGIGLPPIETMARGIPTIVTNASGMTDFANLGIPLNTFAKIDSKYELTFDDTPGFWIEPSLQELKDKMWNVYKNYVYYRQLAQNNASIIRQRYSLEAQTQRFKEILDKYGF